MTTFNVCYTREYIDPENEAETFNSYETIYRNVPSKYYKKFDNEKLQKKLKKYCDLKHNDNATNFTNVTNVVLISEKEYYTSYYDIFGETCDSVKDKKRMWTDYGQCWDRSSLRKDFNPKLTRSKVLHYNNKEVN